MKTGKIKRVSSAALAIFLAVIMAVTFGWGTSLQKAYAGWDYEAEELAVLCDDYDLYSDGEKEYQIHLPDDLEGVQGEDWELNIYVGLPGDEDVDNPEEWLEIFDDGDDYSYDSDSQTLTLQGDKIWSKVKNTDFRCISIFLELDVGDERDPYRTAYNEFISEAYTYYAYEDDMDLLPGWMGEVSSLRAEVCNAEHPDVDSYDLDVTNLSSSDRSIVSVSKRNGIWEYTAKAEGEATMTVTFKDLDDSTNSYQFKVYVKNELVICYVNAFGSENALPGRTVDLWADAWYYTIDKDGEEVSKKLEGSSLTWWIDEEHGSDFATVAPSASDPTMATVTFDNKKPEDSMESATVWVKASAEGKDGNAVENSDHNDVFKCESYFNIVPDTLDPYLEVGDTVTFKPKFKYYTISNPNGVIVSNATINLSEEYYEYNRESWEIESISGGFTIKRLTPYPDTLWFQVSWKESGDTLTNDYPLYFFELPSDPGDPEDPGDLEPQTIEVDPEMTIAINAKGKYEPQQIVIENENELAGAVSYTSSNKKIATVSGTGLVKGIKAGETKITVSVAGDSTHAPATAEINVLVPTKISSIALKKTFFTYNGENQIPALTKINKKKAAKFIEGQDYEIETVGDTVNAGSYQFIVRGIGKYAGEVKKTVRIAKANQTITVDVPKMVIGDVVKLDPAANETDIFTYKSANKKAATVDEEGNVTAIKAATVKITITAPACDNYKKGTRTIKIKIVKKPQGLSVADVGEVYVGNEFYLDVNATDPVAVPKVAAADKKSKKIVRVDKDGKITALKQGTAKVRISLAGDATHAKESVTIPITVVAPEP